MAKLSEYMFVASIFMTGLALVLYLAYAISGLRAARMQTAGGPGTSGTVGMVSGPRTAAIGRYATLLTWLATVTLLVSLVFRAIVTGHGPFANMYEFSMAFAFGILVTYLYFEHKYHQRILALIALPVALGMLLYAATIPASIEPLVPALQNNLLLTVHVATAIVAYGSFAIAFAASYLFLLQTGSALTIVSATVAGAIAAVVGAVTGEAANAFVYGMAVTVAVLLIMASVTWLTNRGALTSGPADGASGGRWGLPKPMVLDEIGYRAVVVGFPFLTLTIILGAVWAETAWGTYWSWDPKETASLVTWLIYGAYLHARVMRGWRGNRAAWLLVIGFLATLLTYFGNLIFGGLHSYSGLG
ncbi:MAG: Heme exporter protein [Chloroflexota bacterium]|nr:Heme exporter protein [Chloroflexota bacterium]